MNCWISESHPTQSFSIHLTTYVSPAVRAIEGSYALRYGNRIFERPQYVWARCALAIHGDDIQSVVTCYDFISTMKFMPSSATLIHAGTEAGQLSSCFLQTCGPSTLNIFNTLESVANICTGGGGVGLGLQHIPSKG